MADRAWARLHVRPAPFAVAMGLSILAAPGSACSPGLPDEDLPLVQGANCAFENGGLRDYFSGGPISDVGGGVILQRLTSNGLSHTETLLVVDCATGQMVTINGLPRPGEPVSTCGMNIYLDTLFAPEGPLTVNRGESLLDIATKALGAGVEVDQGSGWYDDYGTGDQRPDFLCGCALFYPDAPVDVRPGQGLSAPVEGAGR